MVYAGELGLEVYSREAGRHTFFRCGAAMFLIFNQARTSEPAPADGRLVVPPHGATGPGHVAFRVPEASLPAWRARLLEAGIAIEADIAWPGGGRLREPRIEPGTVSNWRRPLCGDCRRCDAAAAERGWRRASPITPQTASSWRIQS